MQLDIISPDKNIFSGEVTSVVVPGIDGSLGILKDHAPLISALGNGTIVYKDDKDQEVELAIKGGVLEVLNNKVIILAD